MLLQNKTTKIKLKKKKSLRTREVICYEMIVKVSYYFTNFFFVLVGIKYKRIANKSTPRLRADPRAHSNHDTTHSHHHHYILSPPPHIWSLRDTCQVSRTYLITWTNKNIETDRISSPTSRPRILISTPSISSPRVLPCVTLFIHPK